MNGEIVQNLKLLSPELVLVFFLVVLFTVDSIWEQTRKNFVPLALVFAACLLGTIATCWVSKLAPTVFSRGS